MQTTKTKMISKKPLRRINSDRGEDDYLSKRNFLKSYTRLKLHQLACTHRLCEGRARVHACRPYIARVYLCGSRKKNTSKQRNKDNWYGRPESLLAQTFAETLKIRNETNFLKIPKKNIPRNPRDPQYGRQFCCGWKSLLRIYHLRALIMHAENDHFKGLYFLIFSQHKTPHSCNIKV
jgi:hypothetical protein